MFHLGHFSFNKIIGRKSKRDVKVYKNIVPKRKRQSGRKKIDYTIVKSGVGHEETFLYPQGSSGGLIIKYT